MFIVPTHPCLGNWSASVYLSVCLSVYYLEKNKSPGRLVILQLWYTWFDMKIGDQNEANKQGYQMALGWDSLLCLFRFYIKISENVDFRKWTQSLNRIWMHDVLLLCHFDMQNLKGKSITILKLLIRAIYCRQAETHSSICLDSTSKRVRTLILKNCKK